MIRLIASDIDGTLIPEGTNSLPADVYEMIREVTDQGLTFVISTGRHAQSVHHLFEPVKDRILMITSNGTYAGSWDDMLFQYVIDRDVVLKLIHDFDTLGLSWVAETKDQTFTYSKDEGFYHVMTEDYGYALIVYDDDAPLPENIMKFSLYSPVDILQDAGHLVPDWRQFTQAVVSGRNWINFVPVDAGKGNALKALADRLKVTPDEIAAFGDQENDISMLAVAAHSYAMANAAEIVKNNARFTCPSCESGGVVTTVKRLIRNPR